jgi:DNA-binding winged helix-turn-helix (wHTH) protein
MELHREGQLVPLTPQEFKMLRFFLNNQNRVISRIELLNEVWGYNNYPTTRTVDTHMLRLRQKLEKEPDDPVRFQTVHGIGYKFLGGAAHHPVPISEGDRVQFTAPSRSWMVCPLRAISFDASLVT